MLARYELDHSETEMCQPSSGKVSRFAECHHSVAFLYLIRGVNIVSTTRLEQTEISSPPFPGNDFVNPAEAARDTRLAAWEFPKKTRLTDTGVYLAIKYLGRGDRNRRHPYDFIHIGHIFRGRVPSGKPVILWAHGLAWIAVWRKSHIRFLRMMITIERIYWGENYFYSPRYPKQDGSKSAISIMEISPDDKQSYKTESSVPA